MSIRLTILHIFMLTGYVLGACESYQINLNTTATCAPFVSTTGVYVPAGITQFELDARLFQSDPYKLLQKLVSIIPISCYQSVASLICQGSFPACDYEPASEIWYPTYPCYHSCQETLKACGDVWSSVGIPSPINCTSPNPIIGNNPWPTEDCNSDLFPANPVATYVNPTVTTCPSVYALRAKIRHNSEAPCSLRCPDPSYTPQEFHTIAIVNIILAVISLVLLIYVIGGYIMDYTKRQFPARLQFWLLIAIFGFQIGTLMPGHDPVNTTMCVDETTYSTQSNNAICGTQGFFLIFFSLAAALWLLAQSAVTFVCIVLEKRPKFMKHYEKYIHVIVWGVSCIFIIVTLATHSIDFSYSTRIYCFISVEVKHNISIDYPLYYIPMTVIFGAIFVCFVAALAKLIFYGMKNKQLASKSYVRAQRRIMVVIALMIILFACVFSFRYNNSVTDYKEKRDENRTKWVNCKLRAELLFDSNFPPECDSDVNPHRTSYSAKMFQNVGLAVLGAWVFLGFGTDAATFKQWVLIFQSMYHRDMSGFWRRLKSNSDRELSTSSPPASGKRFSENSLDKSAS